MRPKTSKRAVELLYPPDRDGIGIVCIVEKGKSFYYAFQEIPCEIGGRGFAVQRLDRDELYHVRIGAPPDCSCECLGFLRHGYCKHITGLLVLAEFDLL